MLYYLHYWSHPNILREGDPLRGEGAPYDELPGLHLHIRDPWSTLSRVLSTAEGAFFGKFANGTKASFEPFEILNPGLIYKWIVCSLKETRVHNSQSPNFNSFSLILERLRRKSRPELRMCGRSDARMLGRPDARTSGRSDGRPESWTLGRSPSPFS